MELRQYQLHPGRRDDLITLFDREFLEPQDELGACVVGQFRDLDDPDAFVWLRSFADLPARKRALEGFYGGPVWAAHRDEANATMISWDDVLLLKPVGSASGLPRCSGSRPRGGQGPHALIDIDVHHFAAPPGDDLLDFVRTEVEPQITEEGRIEVALLETLAAENTFPALPVRDGYALVRISRFPEAEAYARHRARLESSEQWRQTRAELEARGVTSTQRLRLEPTERSLLR